jgi:hypothetical protein
VVTDSVAEEAVDFGSFAADGCFEETTVGRFAGTTRATEDDVVASGRIAEELEVVRDDVTAARIVDGTALEAAGIVLLVDVTTKEAAPRSRKVSILE